MNVMIILLTIANAAFAWGAYAIIRRGLPDRLTQSVLCPATFLVFISAAFTLDFVVLATQVTSTYPLFERHQSIGQREVVQAFAIFTIYQFIVMVAIVFSSCLPLHHPAFDHQSNRRARLNLMSMIRPSEGTMRLFVLLVMSIYTVSVAIYAWKTRGANASYQVLSRENPLIDISVSIVIPTLAYLGTFTRRYRSVFLLGIYVAITLAIAGKRGPVLATGLVTLASLYRFNLTIPRKSFILLIPLLICFLLTQRFMFRESFGHHSISDFTSSSGGLFNVFFGTSEVSNAEFLTIMTTNSAVLTRSPKELLMAAALAPIPRSIIKSKPLGSSAEVTAIMSPDRWRWTKSELLVTGYGDLIMHFGIVIGACVLGIMAFLWSLAIRIVCTRQQNLNVIMFTLLMWCYYIFMRGDTFNMARFVWFYILMGFVALVFVQTKLSIPRIELLPRPRLVR